MMTVMHGTGWHHISPSKHSYPPSSTRLCYDADFPVVSPRAAAAPPPPPVAVQYRHPAQIYVLNLKAPLVEPHCK